MRRKTVMKTVRVKTDEAWKAESLSEAEGCSRGRLPAEVRADSR
jgi:hypothetical protein